VESHPLLTSSHLKKNQFQTAYKHWSKLRGMPGDAACSFLQLQTRFGKTSFPDGFKRVVGSNRRLPYHFGQFTMCICVFIVTKIVLAIKIRNWLRFGASLHQTEYQISDELWCKFGAPDFYGKSPIQAWNRNPPYT